ncbi:hypothetical protein M9H77_17158 [Catharanthus roseus]|uniref:Uncharacterized protein n=1 Tax=Catharanthus roseus TaxID=4058 RepID=A0ACC0B3U6_CATRO|nr:hypothetical protein M9H77_17158 [Catharanthus roseus]
MDGSPYGLLWGLLGYQSPRLSQSLVIIHFSVYISIHFREKLSSKEYGWRLRGDALLIRIRAKEVHSCKVSSSFIRLSNEAKQKLSEDPLTADAELTRVFAKQKIDEQTVMQWEPLLSDKQRRNSVWKVVQRKPKTLLVVADLIFFFSLVEEVEFAAISVVVKQAGIGSLAEDDALNILSPVYSKSVCLKQGVPVSNDSISTGIAFFYNKERAGTELVDTVESVVDSEAVDVVVADHPYLKRPQTSLYLS